MTETLASIFVIIGIASVFVVFAIFFRWFPATNVFRVAEKKKGTLMFYRAEVRHPFFGWSPFWASKYDGVISRCYDWEMYTSGALNNIEVFKQLKPIK